ncbi:MAG: endonuclease VII domain-containing protein [Fimbriimonadaceae bacterium]|nr:endonuclease VII domain-containing protein [Fimbriimonadaceae bacterium]
MSESAALKKCSRCQQEKLLDDFTNHRNGNHGKRYWCRACETAHRQRWKSENPQRAISVSRRHELRTYGLTEADFQTLLDKQGGRCAICGTDKPGRGHAHFSVDHDHRTGQIRGLLCGNCNTGLGLFSEDTDLLSAAREYLLISRGIIR